MAPKLAFTASEAPLAREGRAELAARCGEVPLEEADVIVALGGDGFMLQTLHAHQGLGKPVYGVNRGTVGFLMDACSEARLTEAIGDAGARLHSARSRNYQVATDILL